MVSDHELILVDEVHQIWIPYCFMVQWNQLMLYVDGGSDTLNIVNDYLIVYREWDETEI